MIDSTFVYLDHNATTPLRREVEEAMKPFWRTLSANPASRHSAGQQAWNALEEARGRVAEWIGADPDEVVFTSGATESNWAALLGRFEYLLEQGRKPESVRIAVSAVEHPCVKACAARLQKRGADVHSIPVTQEGFIDPRFFGQDSGWDLVAVMAANHETGAIQPLAAVAALLDPEKTFFHTDAAQWAGRTEGNALSWGAASLSLSAHKLNGPKGIGALVLRRGGRIVPFLPGSQEGGLRGGTVNVPAAVGFGEAARLNRLERETEPARLQALRELLWSKLQTGPLPVKRTVSADFALPNTLHVRFPGRRGERMVDALDRRGVCCSSGPACASGASEASPVLLAMGYGEEEAWEGVRFSLGRDTSRVEIESAASIILECLHHLAKHVA